MAKAKIKEDMKAMKMDAETKKESGKGDEKDMKKMRKGKHTLAKPNC